MKLTGLIALCVVVLFLAPFVGLTSPQDLTSFIFWNIRFPRIINGILVGATLATAGSAFQTL